MFWRKWFVRLVVYAVVGGCAGGVLLYQRFTNPAAVREQVLAKLKVHFPGAVVTVDSARLRILGGISVQELRLARKDDPDKSEILHVPSAVLFHDKEKILDGEVTFRRIKLERPHFRMQRNRDGSWNWQGISGQLQPNLPLPIVDIHQGTLVLEDRGESGAGKTVELTDVDLRLVNDPLDLVTIEGSANSEVAGKLHVQGEWQRGTQELTLTIRAEQISLAGIVVESLEKLCPLGSLAGLKLEGKADLKAELAYRPGSAQPLAYDAWLSVSKGKLQHPKLPLPLEELEASLHCSNGELRLEKLRAKSGRTEIEVRASALIPAIDQTFECEFEARHLEMRDKLFACLPEKTPNLHDLFKPTGLATFRAHLAKRDGSWTLLRAQPDSAAEEPSNLQLIPENMGVTFAKFPYPLERLTGSVDMNLVTKRIQVNVTGYTGPRPVVITGTCLGERQQADIALDIIANDIPLDEKLVNALIVANFRKLAQSFNASGRGDIKAHIRHQPGADYHNEYHVRFHDAAIRWDPFPFPLENVSGYLDIYPKHWEFREGRGTHRGCLVLVDGGSHNRQAKGGAASPGVFLKIEGRNIAVDGELRQALEPIKQLARSWETLRPRGQLNFKATIDHRTLDPEDADVHLEVRGGTIEPAFFPYALDDITGTFHFHNNKLEIADASARHHDARLSLGHGTVRLPPGGGHYTDLADLRAEGLIIDEDLLRALPSEEGKAWGGLRGGADSLKLQGPLALRTQLVVFQGAQPGSRPDIGWDGQGWLQNATFYTGLAWTKVSGTVGLRGHYNGSNLAGVTGNILLDEATLLGQPFHKLHAILNIKESAPDVLLLNLKAPIFGGDISGEASIEFNSSHRYELHLTGSQLDLGQFAEHNLGPTSKLQGAAMAQLHLTGQGNRSDTQGNRSDTLDGNGSIDVPSGRLYNLPLLLDILKFLGLRWPDRTAFDELHAMFSIHGQRVSVSKLELLGNAVSLTGQGEFNLDGTNVALDFYPGWARLYQLFPPGLRPLPPTVSKNLLTIEMRGKVTANEKDRKFTMKPVPGIIDPLMHVRDRLIGAPSMDNRDQPRMLPELGRWK